MKNTWKNIKEKISNISPTIADSFNEPASQQDIEKLESVIGQKLPESFVQYLKTFNGQDHDNFDIFFFGYNCLLSVEEIIECYEMQMDYFGDDDEIDFIQENKIKPRIWDKGWIPFSENNNQYLIIDLNPGKNGVYGQVFQNWPGRDYEEEDIIVANSFEDFSQHILKIIKSEDYIYDDEFEAIEPKDNWII